MSRMKFYCDEDRCIECYACSVGCAEAHELPTGINRRKVITLNAGKEGLEYSLSIACMHCTDAPCEQVCPVDCFYIREDGIVLHDKHKCIGCGYCLYACPFGAPQFPRDGAFGIKGAMDKCTMCAGGPEETNSHEERHLYGQNRIAEGKVPLCAAVCATNALLVGDSQKVSEIYRQRVLSRGHKHSKTQEI
ncbi:formate dehydrogenase FDH3 subunit beta [Halarcobacter sp.]|uniref:formate dehydrogenase FDH3 subunit beta n=1 Tax=Halarcobacter sp. TaxID=2321133 RepID=UPI0029F4B6DC|nr:formate dehydrogenase FDH3 subunit beta [Halarcobacter sp.]